MSSINTKTLARNVMELGFIMTLMQNVNFATELVSLMIVCPSTKTMLFDQSNNNKEFRDVYDGIIEQRYLHKNNS